MATTKILNLNDSGSSYHGRHLKKGIEYILNPEKTQDGKMVRAVNCQVERAFEQMRETKKQYGKNDKRQGYHIILSFAEGEVSPDVALEITEKFVNEYLADNYEAVFAVHNNTKHVHSHIMFNSVSFATGRKYRYEKGDWARKIQPIVNRLCNEYGLSTIEVNDRNEYYKDWNEYRDGDFVWSKMIKRDVDACIILADSFEEFVKQMEQKGYEIKHNKYISVKPPGMKRFRRLKTLGSDYAEAELIKRIEEKYEKTTNEYISSNMIESHRVRFYKRAKLSGLQKKYYAKLYRLGRIKQMPYSQSGKLWEDLKEFNKLQKQYLFLVKNNINSVPQLLLYVSELEEKKKTVNKDKSRAYRDDAMFKDLFEKLQKMNELQYARKAFDNGDIFFMDEAAEYEAIKKEIQSKGYQPDELIKIFDNVKKGIEETSYLEKAIYKELRIAKSIVGDITPFDKIGIDIKKTKEKDDEIEKSMKRRSK